MSNDFYSFAFFFDKVSKKKTDSSETIFFLWFWFIFFNSSFPLLLKKSYFRDFIHFGRFNCFMPSSSFFWHYSSFFGSFSFKRSFFLQNYWDRSFAKNYINRFSWLSSFLGYELFSYSQRLGSNFPFIYLIFGKNNVHLSFRSSFKNFSMSVGSLEFKKANRKNSFSFTEALKVFLLRAKQFSSLSFVNVVLCKNSRNFRFDFYKLLKKSNIKIFSFFKQLSVPYGGCRLKKSPRR
jgi:ribosomal protein S11